MKKYFCFIIFLLSFEGFVFSQANADFVSLFDGSSINGWHLFKKPDITPAWVVQDGAIYLDVNQKEGRGDLVTNQSFKDFHLQFEWKVAPGSNSGVIFFVQENHYTMATWHTGPEFQVVDNTGYPDKLDAAQKSASLYDLIPSSPELIRPTGEWNAAEIIFQKGRLEFMVNGKPGLSVEYGSPQWNAAIAGSKFAKMNNFARNTEGRIALQDHGGAVWYRNIRIKSL